MSNQTLKIRRPDDWHVHFRQDELIWVSRETAKVFARALAMPNLDPPIVNSAQAWNYNLLLENELKIDFPDFHPFFAIKLTTNTTPDDISEAAINSILLAKLYPQGVTTNSQDGIKDFKKLYPVFKKMQEIGMVLSIHGEMPGDLVLAIEAEKLFLPILIEIATKFPKLKIVMEHLSTAAAVQIVSKLPNNVAATITVHHLELDFDQVVAQPGYIMRPHNYCKPIANNKTDRDALRQAAISGNPKFFFGSDSAPHLRAKKEHPLYPAAGVFSAPVAIQLLTEIFESMDALDKLENFTSKYGAQFYNLPLNDSTITLIKESWQVPKEINGVVPFLAGHSLFWQVI